MLQKIFFQFPIYLCFMFVISSGDGKLSWKESLPEIFVDGKFYGSNSRTWAWREGEA